MCLQWCRFPQKCRYMMVVCGSISNPDYLASHLAARVSVLINMSISLNIHQSFCVLLMSGGTGFIVIIIVRSERDSVDQCVSHFTFDVFRIFNTLAPINIETGAWNEYVNAWIDSSARRPTTNITTIKRERDRDMRNSAPRLNQNQNRKFVARAREMCAREMMQFVMHQRLHLRLLFTTLNQ